MKLIINCDPLGIQYAVAKKEIMKPGMHVKVHEDLDLTCCCY